MEVDIPGHYTCLGEEALQLIFSEFTLPTLWTNRKFQREATFVLHAEGEERNKQFEEYAFPKQSVCLVLRARIE